jgi:uncharacterized protein (TIGR00255 family)
MLRSMTAFARREIQAEWGSAVWELRSVNHRYLDVTVRLPEDLRGIEPEVRTRVGERARRGKLECNLRYQAGTGSAAGLRVNRAFAEQLARASREVDQLLYNAAPVHSLDVLRWPGVLETDAPDRELLTAELLRLLDLALGELIATREREGARVAAFLEARVAEMEPLVASVRVRVPSLVAATRERLRARLAELRTEVDTQRLEQELVLFAQRVDVSEELDRLAMHIAEVRRVLRDSGAVGRRLDFLMQEMNREANTLSSKSVDTETTRAAVDLKVLVEQMREQVQNVE